MSLELIHKYSISAKKALGQNFLVDENITSEISEVINIMGSNIVEVGPGYGVLTEKLCLKKPKSLHLIELDNDMIAVLNSRKDEGDFPMGEIDFQIHNTDVLEYIPEFENYSVIANIPYYITSPILRHFLYELDSSPQKMCILMQKDVGDKILGKGKNKSSVLSLMIAKKCRVEEKIFVPKESFIPKPKVESSVLLFESYDDFLEIDDSKFLEVIKKGFLAPRKKLINNLVSGGYEREKIEQYFCQQGYDVNLRGEDLNISQWCDLVKYIA